MAMASMYTDYQKAYSKSFVHEQNQKYTKAIQILKKIYGQYSYDYELNLRLGWLSYLNKKDKTASKYLKIAMKIKPSGLEAKNMILLPLTRLRKWKTLRHYARLVIKRSPTNYYANIRLAYAYYLQRKSKRALGVYLKLYTYYPSDTSVKLGLAATYLQMRKKDKALVFYKEILKTNIYHKAAQIGLKNCTFENKRWSGY